MRTLSLLLLLLTFILGCQKKVEQKGEDLLVKLIVDGKWVVTEFKKGSADVTSSFTGYQFQFRENRTVDALKDNLKEKTGTWDGDAATRTIFSHFSNVTEPLQLLNGAFSITDSGLTYVKARQTVNGEIRTLRLDKI